MAKASKTYDLAVKTGSYTDSNGEERGRYTNIGAVFEGDKGPYMVLNRTFNPAGVPNPDDRDSVIVSMFEPKEDEGRGNGRGNGGGRGGNTSGRSGGGQRSTGSRAQTADDDDIPF